MTVILVRHARPEVVASLDPREWVLSEAGRVAAKELSKRLPTYASWVSSTEAKAAETLRCATQGRVDVSQDAGFDECRRDEPFDDDHLARRLAWVTGTLDARHVGWETPEETAARFEQAVLRHTKPGRPLIIASHGMAMTAWLLHFRRVIDVRDAGEFWMNLAFPDVVQVD